MRWAAILAGGSGTRFWPLSTPNNPKQFLPLASETPLLRQAVERLDPLIPANRVLVITGQNLADRTRALLPEVPTENVLAEPCAAQTAPALAWATHEINRRDDNATVLSLHADWAIGDDNLFREHADMALSAAERHEMLVTVGVVPIRPEIGYGYVQPGPDLDDTTKSVDRFIEKPNETRARELIKAGALWNSGMFAWTSRVFFEETEEHVPELAPHLPLLDQNNVDGFFKSVTPIVIDISHFERSNRVAIVPGKFPWDDVGTWPALGRIRGTDKSGNCLVGNAAGIDSRDCVVWSDGEPVVISGLKDIVVVRANGVTLVATRERALNLKETLDQLPKDILETP